MDLTALQSTLRQFAAERDWQPFHTPKNLAMALMVEAAELAELFQWMTPEQSQAAGTDRVTRERVADEVADVLLYLLQIADHTGVDLKRAVGRKLVKNASKHPPLRPGIAAGASGPSRVDTHVLVDWENVRPDDADIRRLVPDVTDVWLFHGPEQKAVGARHASFGEQLTVVKTSRAGRNALDMHLSFYLGHIAARHPEARFVVVSNDQDYLPVLAHAVERGYAAQLIGFDAAAAKVAAKKTAAKTGSAGRKTAARSAAADNVAAQKGAAQEAAAKQAAVKQPAAKKGRAQDGASQKGALQKVAPARTRGSKPRRDGQAEPLSRPQPMQQATQSASQHASPKPAPSAKRGRKQEPAHLAMDAPAAGTAPGTATAAGVEEPRRSAAASKKLHAQASPASTATPAAKTKLSSANTKTAPAKAVTPAPKWPPAKKAAAETSPAKASAARTSPAKTPASKKPASRLPPAAADAASSRRNSSGAPGANKALAHVLASLKTMSRPTRQARLLATVKSLLGPTADEQAVNAVLAQLLASGKVSIDASGAVGYTL